MRVYSKLLLVLEYSLTIRSQALRKFASKIRRTSVEKSIMKAGGVRIEKN